MKAIPVAMFATVAAGFVVAATPLASGLADEQGSPIFGITIPDGYRQWELIAPSQETGALDELRVILGNGVSVSALDERRLSIPDGAVLVKLAWKHIQSDTFSSAFVPGPATTVQVMVKDSRKFAATGGWGFGRFVNGRPVDEAQHKTCFPCHEANAKQQDLCLRVSLVDAPRGAGGRVDGASGLWRKESIDGAEGSSRIGVG